MSDYSTYAGTEITQFVTAGSTISQTTVSGMAKDDTKTVTHAEDAAYSRIVQVQELVSGDNIVDTSLDFDLADEGNYIQEDSISGTDFTGDKVQLYIGGASNYVEYQLLTETAGDSYGNAPDTDGTTLVVGDIQDDDQGTNSGAAYIYTTNVSGMWTFDQKIIGGATVGYDDFGAAIAIKDDIVLIGSHGQNSDQGSVYCFQNVSGTWTEKQQFFASNPGQDWYCSQIGLSDDKTFCLVGAYNEDTTGSNDGCVYYYTSTASGTIWTEQGKLTITAPGVLNFGRGISVYGNKVAIGCPGDSTAGSDAGSVYIFETTDSGNSWDQIQQITTSDHPPNQFGLDVVMNGDMLIGSAYLDDIQAINAGAAYIFKTNVSGIFEEKQKIYASDPEESDFFSQQTAGGHSVGIYNNTAVVSCYQKDAGEGALYVFKSFDDGTTWSGTQKIQGTQDSTAFGQFVALYDDSEIFVSAYGVGGADTFYSLRPSATYAAGPYYVTTSDNNQITLSGIGDINSCTITATVAGGTSIKSLVSFDGRATWEKWGGSSWATHTGGLDNLQTGNTTAEIQTGLSGLAITDEEYVDFAFDLSTENSSLTPSIDQITLDHDEQGTYVLINSDDTDLRFMTSTSTRLIKQTDGITDVFISIVL